MDIRPKIKEIYSFITSKIQTWQALDMKITEFSDSRIPLANSYAVRKNFPYFIFNVQMLYKVSITMFIFYKSKLRLRELKYLAQHDTAKVESGFDTRLVRFYTPLQHVALFSTFALFNILISMRSGWLWIFPTVFSFLEWKMVIPYYMKIKKKKKQPLMVVLSLLEVSYFNDIHFTLYF